MNADLLHKYFKLYSNCFLVKGYRRSLILDVSRQKQFLIPNSLESLLVELQSIKVGDAYSKYSEYKQYLDEYFDYLIQNELGHFLEEEELEMFPAMNLAYSEPRHITNSIVEFSEFNEEKARTVISKISELLCEAVTVRFLNTISWEGIEPFLALFEGTIVCNLVLQLNYNEDYSIDSLNDLMSRNPRLDRVEIYGVPLLTSEMQGVFKIRFAEKRMDDISCGCISSSYFSANLRFFVEAQSRNTCLNKKLCINSKGDIKNCLHADASFGNIYTSNLQSVIAGSSFTSLWQITKDSVAICKDCEYRYVCTDCRTFIKFSEDIYSLPSKCTYNPYVAKWAGEEGYVPVEECGSYSQETGFVVDAVKVSALNQRVMA